MKLKYYLRGLGLGLIVAALILGIHHVRSSNDSISDAEIRKRAAELGMVDEPERVLEDIESTEEMLADIESQADEFLADDTADITGQSDTAEPEGTEEPQDIDVTDVTSESDITDNNDDSDNSPVIEDTTSEITTDAPDDPGLDYPTEDDSFYVSEPETETSEQASGSASSGGPFTISSGDSSDRVARKLADAGYVASASEFDAYLCAHGYDRVISTGNYTITEGMSYEEIARLITHR